MSFFPNSRSKGINSIAIGANAVSNQFKSIAIGNNTVAASQGVVIGDAAQAIGVRSTVGVDSRLGCETPTDTDRLSRDAVGRLMGILLRPYELVRMAVQESDLMPSTASARAGSMPPIDGVS